MPFDNKRGKFYPCGGCKTKDETNHEQAELLEKQSLLAGSEQCKLQAELDRILKLNTAFSHELVEYTMLNTKQAEQITNLTQQNEALFDKVEAQAEQIADKDKGLSYWREDSTLGKCKAENKRLKDGIDAIIHDIITEIGNRRHVANVGKKGCLKRLLALKGKQNEDNDNPQH